jgi:hypothetical protein
MPASRFDRLPASGIVVGTDGSVAAIETARTMIETAFPFQASPLTVYETQNEQLLSAWQQLANVVILVGMPIAGCSLAVSVAAGLMDRNGFVAGGLLLSLGIIAATFPLLNRVTGPESARGE